MKQSNQSYFSGFRRFQKIIASFTLVFFFFQTIATAVASTLTAAQIQVDLDSSVEFERVYSGPYQYDSATYLEGSIPSGQWNIETFYKQLRDQYLPALGEPTYVPIGVGDITTIIPVYDNPKIVGSPFVQSRYVRTQIRRLLGRHLIDSANSAYASESAQLATLYNNAIDYAQDYYDLYGSTLIYGTPLSEETDNGPADMIWPERRVINGEEVIVPIVYLTASTYNDRKVDEHVVEFNGNASFGSVSVDDVDIKFGRDAFLKVAGNIALNESNVVSTGELMVVAGGSITLLSSVLEAQGDLSIAAQNFIAQTLVHRYDYGNEHGSVFGEVTGINSVSGDVVVRSYGNVVIQGVEVSAGDSIQFAANGNISILPQGISNSSIDIDGRWKRQRSTVEYLSSTLTAEESIALIANGSIEIDASEIEAGNGHINILAALGITVKNEFDVIHEVGTFRSSKKKKDEELYKTVAIRTLLDAGKTVTLHSEAGDINLQAVDIRSTDGTSVSATGGSVNLLMAVETNHYSYSATSKRMFTTRTVNRGHIIETPIYNTVVGGFSVGALYGVNVQIEDDDSRTFDEQVDYLTNQAGMSWIADLRDPAYLAEHNIDIDWEEIELAYEEWDVDTTALNGAAMALITIVVAVVTAGAGAAAINAVNASLQGAIANAAFTSMISTAAVASSNALVDGGSFSDIHEAAFEAVVSDEGVRSIATAAITAGVLHGIDAEFFNVGEADLNLAQELEQAVYHAAGSAAVNTAINGGSLTDNFKNSLITNSISVIGSHMADGINDSAKNGQINDAIRYVAHAGAGCIVGVASASGNSQDDGCASGALGSVVSTIATDIYRSENIDEIETLLEEEQDYFDSLYYNSDPDLNDGNPLTTDQVKEIAFSSQHSQRKRITALQNNGVDLGKLSAALSAFIVGLDVNIASTSGGITAQSNVGYWAAAISLKAAVDETVRRNHIISVSRLDPAELDGKIAEVLDPDLEALAEALGLVIETRAFDGLSYVELDGVYYPIENDQQLENAIRIQAEDIERLNKLAFMITSAEEATDEFKATLLLEQQLAIESAIRDAYDAASRLDALSGTSYTAEDVAAAGFSQPDQLVQIVQEAVYVGTDIVLAGTLTGGLSLLGVEPQTQLTDEAAAYAYNEIFVRLDQAGIPREEAEPYVQAAMFVVQVRDVAHTVRAAGNGASDLIRQIDDRSDFGGNNRPDGFGDSPVGGGYSANNHWEHQDNTTVYIRQDLGFGEDVATEVTVRATITRGDGTSESVTIRLDQLTENRNVPGEFIWHDAKYSAVKDLTSVTPSQLGRTFTRNQRTVLDWQQEPGAIMSYEVRGVKAEDVFSQYPSGSPISLSPGVDIYVNTPDQIVPIHYQSSY